MAEDAIKIAPDQYKVVLENDRIRVLEYRDKPGSKTGMHYHPDVLAIPIASGKFKFTFEDGNSTEVEVKPNEPVFMPGHNHITENVGGTDGHVILVELK